MDEFVLLFGLLNDITLSNEKDQIRWKWTASGIYTTASAYQIQFEGSFPDFRASTLWQARTEPKCRFFAWLAVHERIQTADNLIKKRWPCDPSCALCYCIPETAEHLLTHCNFAEAVWDKVVQALDIQQPLQNFQRQHQAMATCHTSLWERKATEGKCWNSLLFLVAHLERKK